MNFLAHLFLSGNNEGHLIGNFIADEVKGKSYLNFPEPIIQGILMHRKIDTFTDHHPIVKEAKGVVQKEYGKFSGIVIDIYFDHLLAVNWERYSNETLRSYTYKIYELLQAHKDMMPLDSQRFCHYMLEYDIFYNYSKAAGVERVFEGLAGRAAFKSGMESAGALLQEKFSVFDGYFNAFFPLLNIQRA